MKRMMLTFVVSMAIAGNSGWLAVRASASPPVKIKRSNVLKGEINQNKAELLRAQYRALGFLAQKDSASEKCYIDKVFPGSTAWYHGIKAGDEITASTVNEVAGALQAGINIRRAGQTFGVQLSTFDDYRQYLGNNNSDDIAAATGNKPPGNAGSSKQEVSNSGSLIARQSQSVATGLPVTQNSPASLMSPASAAMVPTLSGQAAAESSNSSQLEGETSTEQHERIKLEQAFRGKDLAVLIDRSGSMDTTDCPAAESRWQWCSEQITALSQKTKELLPAGFSLILFNNHCKIFDSANIDTIANAFLKNKPEGGTDIAGAISSVLRQYSEKNAGSSSKSLIIAIITDGAPNDEKALRNTLIAVSNGMTTSEDISIVFLQVGEDDQASTYLEELDRSLVQEGAKFHIVHSIAFSDVKSCGLLNSLASCIN